VGEKFVTDRAPTPGDDVHESVWRADLLGGCLEVFEQFQTHERRVRRRLPDDCVPCAQRRSYLVNHQIQREIERRDGRDHAQRLALRETVVTSEPFLSVHRHVLTEQSLGFLTGHLECLDRPVDLSPGFVDWFPLFAGHDAGDRFGVRL
jgi:hypothetical protein